MSGIVTHFRRLKNSCWDALSSRLTHRTKPLRTSLSLATLTDLGKSKSQLITENALLRQQVIVLRRQVKRPTFTRTDRILLVLLARLLRMWQQALVIVQPDTLLRWHRELFRLVWKRKSKASSHQPKIAAETITLIKQMAKDNQLWGAERIRGELLKLGIHVCKRTIQKYMRKVRTYQPRGQKWSMFLRNHAAQVWACDFLQVTDLFFRPLFAFFMIELKSRKVIHVGVTRSPTDAWVAQQLREATPYGQAPKYLIHDNDNKFGSCFARVATTSGVKLLKTPYHAPRANAICERFLRSVRQECLDHLLILQEKQLQRVLNAYVMYFNRARPHQGIGQQIPEQGRLVPFPPDAGNKVIALLVVGGLHHDYRWVARSGTTWASGKRVDEFHPARSVVSEEAFCSSLMQLEHAFLYGLLPISPCFLLWTRTIPLLDRWLSSPDREKEADDGRPKDIFFERMIQVANTGLRERSRRGRRKLKDGSVRHRYGSLSSVLCK